MTELRPTLNRRFPALASRDFSIFWTGHLLSLIGTSMQNTAQPLLAYRLSGRPFDLGLIGFALALPTFFLALPSGVWIEHLDKRRLLIITQTAMMLDALILAWLALSGVIQIWHIALLSLVLGVTITFEITARQSMLIELVGREALPNAIALQTTAFNLSRVIGPALVAPFLLIFPSRGEGWIFLLNAVSFLAIIISLFFVKTRFGVPIQPRTQSIIIELRQGMTYITRSLSVGTLVLLAGMLGLFAFPVLQQLPVVSTDLLGRLGDTRAVVDARNSWLYSAQGAGALIASFMLVMNNSSRLHNLRLILGEAAFILGMLILPASRSLFPAAALVALMGWGGVTQLTTMNTLLQLQVPDGLRGRVFSVYLWAFQGVAPFGSLLIGWMSQSWGLGATTSICGLVCLVGMGGIQLFRLGRIHKKLPANP